MKCAVYTRVSTDNQVEVEFNSCEAQQEKIKSFINSQENMTIYRVYSDPGYTGANLNRPALAELLEDIKNDKINLVISYKIDRLTRSPKDFYQLIELFDQHGVDFLSVSERFDTSTPSGRLLRNIMLTFAQFERELASERTKDKMIQRVQKGMWNGGTTPFGYKLENKKLAINEDEAKVVRSIYESYIAKCPIARMNKETKLGKTRIYTLLRNPVYVGKIKYAGKLWQGNHEPIISDEIFRQTQQIHQKASRTMKPYKNYVLAGLVRCKECNSYMTPCHTNKKKDKRTKRYYYYRCTSTFKKDWNSCQTRQINSNRLDRYIVDNLTRISLDRQYIDNLIFSLNHRRDGGRIGLLERSPKSSNNPPKMAYRGTGEGSNFEGSSGDSPKISAEIFAQTLSRLATSLLNLRGIEKNLRAKQFIKSIFYSKESIQINIFYPLVRGQVSPKISAGGKEKTPTECRGISIKKNTGSPGRARTYDLLVNSQPLYQLSYRGIPNYQRQKFFNYNLFKLYGQATALRSRRAFPKVAESIYSI